MTGLLQSIGHAIVVAAFAVASLFGYQPATVALPTQFGSLTAAADYRTSLSSQISAAATSFVVAATSTASGEHLTQGKVYGLKLGGREYVKGTLSAGRTFTSVTRGLSTVTGTTTAASTAEAWGRGTSVELTDAPILIEVANKLAGVQTIDNLLQYDNTVLVSGSSSTTTVPTKYYVDNVAVAGAPDSSQTIKGILEEATAAEAASGAADGSGNTTAPLALTSSIATSTCQQALSRVIVASSTTGKIDKGCIDQTANYTLTGNSTFSGSNTFSSGATTTMSGGTSLATTTQFGVYGGGLVPPGSVTAYASTTAPAGWLLANGASVLRSDYPVLFSVIGTSYGSADGTHFTLPDLRGRNVLMASTTANIGQSGGESNHTLTETEMPAHTHGLGSRWGGSGSGYGGVNGTSALTSDSTGGNGPHNVLDPYLVLNYIIKY